MIQTKREKERKRITKRNTNRLRELKKGIREKMKTLEERKKEIQKFIRNIYIEEIKK